MLHEPLVAFSCVAYHTDSLVLLLLPAESTFCPTRTDAMWLRPVYGKCIWNNMAFPAPPPSSQALPGYTLFHKSPCLVIPDKLFYAGGGGSIDQPPPPPPLASCNSSSILASCCNKPIHLHLSWQLLSSLLQMTELIALEQIITVKGFPVVSLSVQAKRWQQSFKFHTNRKTDYA